MKSELLKIEMRNIYIHQATASMKFIFLLSSLYLGKDQGQNVREKAKQLVNLLKDDDRLKNERARALKAKERFAQTTCGFGSDGGLDTPSSPKFPAFRGDWGSRESSTVTHLY